MKRVVLKTMEIENFKGLRSFSIECNDDVTRIIGANGTGKTTIYDAYLWLLMGMDSGNRANFKVQPLDDAGQTIDHLTTSVSGEFVFSDARTHVLKRSLSQTWTRRRGTKEDVLTGSETERFIDNVPCKAAEYEKAVREMFCDMDDFKLISSIGAFGKLDMKDKRAKLIQMAGQMPELINEQDYPRLNRYYQTVKSVDAIKKQVLYEMGGLKDKQKEIPVRITENERDMPTGIDFDALRGQLAQKNAEIESIDAKLMKAANSRTDLFSGISAMNDELQRLNAELLEIESGLQNQRQQRLSGVNETLSAASLEVRNLESKSRIIQNEITDLTSRKNRLEKRKAELGEQWEKKNSETWPDTIAVECPTCHRPYDADKVTEMRNEAIKAFNSGKAGVLAQIVAEGDTTVAQLSEIVGQLDAKEKEKEQLMSEITEARQKESAARKLVSEVPTIDNLKQFSKEYAHVSEKKDDLRRKIMAETPSESDDELQMKNRKEQLKREVSTLTMEIAKEANIAKVEKRRIELEEEGTEIATNIAELDAVLFEIQTYQKAYIELVENKVSSMFKYVTWKMYQKNVSNDGETEICECLVNGVPTSTNVNTAGGVNAAIDIINALSEWLDISVPLWIDGKESVTELIETDAQLITLSVVENQPLSIV